MTDEFKNVSENSNLYKNKKRIKTSQYKLTDILAFYNMNQLQCFFCNRLEQELGKDETFEIEHIIQLAENGIDKLDNLQILCTACHKMKNWMIYFVKFKTLKPWYYKFSQDHPDLIEKWEQDKINTADFWDKPDKKIWD